MGFDQFLDDGEPDAGPAAVARARLLAAIEAFEDEGEVCVGNPLAGVAEN